MFIFSSTFCFILSCHIHIKTGQRLKVYGRTWPHLTHQACREACLATGVGISQAAVILLRVTQFHEVEAGLSPELIRLQACSCSLCLGVECKSSPLHQDKEKVCCVQRSWDNGQVLLCWRKKIIGLKETFSWSFLHLCVWFSPVKY